MRQSTYRYNPRMYAENNITLQDVVILSVGIRDNEPKAFDEILVMAKDIPNNSSVYQTILRQMLRKSIDEGFIILEIEDYKFIYSLSEKGIKRYHEIALELLDNAFTS